MSETKCSGFKFGCACSRCLSYYLREFSNSCTYGGRGPVSAEDKARREEIE